MIALPRIARVKKADTRVRFFIAAEKVTARGSRRDDLDERSALSRLSDDFARQTVATLSRQAGLLTTHEMMQALDPNYRSELAETMMAECARLLDDLAAAS